MAVISCTSLLIGSKVLIFYTEAVDLMVDPAQLQTLGNVNASLFQLIQILGMAYSLHNLTLIIIK